MSNRLLPSYLQTAPVLCAGPKWANLEWDCDLREISKEESELPKIFFWLSNRNLYPKAYVKSLQECTRVFAAGLFSRPEDSIQGLNQLWADLQNHSNSFIIGGQTFFSSSTFKEEMWNRVRPQYYFIPRLYFKLSQDGILPQAKKRLKVGLNITHKEALAYQENESLPFDFLQFFSEKEESESQTNATLLSSNSIPSKSNWDKMVRSFKGEKVVYARRLSVTIDGHSHSILHNKWKELDDSTNVFWLKLSPDWWFLSFSPERLFNLNKDQLRIDVLAGTTKRGGTAEEDLNLAQQLMSCPKNHREHQFVLDEVRANISSLGLRPELLFSGKILKLPHVQHLHSLWQAEISSRRSPFDLIQVLHPTPAVGGLPRKIALEQINEFEGYERGLYAAPVGFMSAERSEVFVAIRSALGHENQLHVFAGAGIVSQSDPEMEWQETAQKMKNFVTLEQGSAQ